MRKFDPPPTKYGPVSAVSRTKPAAAMAKPFPGVSAAPCPPTVTPGVSQAKPAVAVGTHQASSRMPAVVPTSPANTKAVSTVQMMKQHSQWDKANKGDLLFRPPHMSSPLRVDQEDVLDNLREEMHQQSVNKDKWRPQPKETVKGRIGEMVAQFGYKSAGIDVVDVNEEMWKNFPAFDHITSDPKFPFSQSKVHIGDSEFYLDEMKKSVKEKTARLKKLAKDYEVEIDARYQMAALFLKKITGSSKKINDLDALSLKLKNETFKKIINEINKIDGDEDFDETHALCKMVGDGIRFPVPLDVYPHLKPIYQRRAYMLKHSTSWFASTLRKSYHMETKKKLSEAQKALKDDPDY